MTNFFEKVKVSDDIRLMLMRMRILKPEYTPVTGYLTVIKNQGKQNEQIVIKNKKNLLSRGGRDYFHAQTYTNTAAGGVGTNFVAVSNEGTNPVFTDTTLVGEITTDGLARALVTTIVHAASSDTTTLTEIFTATGIVNNIHKSALFNQLAIGGTMSHTAPFATDTSKDVDLIIGDTLTIIWIAVLGADP